VRGGGSITPEILTEMRRLQSHGEIYIYEGCSVKSAAWIDNHWHIEYMNPDIPFTDFDYIWAATGREADITSEPIFKNLLQKFPIQIVRGLPVLDNDLKWSRDCDAFIMGAYAALQLGPDAENISGARAGSEKIASAISGGIDSVIGGPNDHNFYSLLTECDENDF